MKYYDKKTNGFYEKNDGTRVEITDAYHIKLLSELINSDSLGCDDNGYPIVIPHATPTAEQKRAGMVMSNAQARLKLIKLGLFDAIDKAILSMPRNAPLYVLWEYGTNFHRTDKHLIAFCTDTLKMTAEEIDALFI